MPHCRTLIAALRRRGYRLTPQREMIIEAIAHGGRHMTAEEVFTRVRDRASAVNIATVYRTLDLLCSEGLASRTAGDDGCMVYATIRHGPHLHLACRRCGCTVEADEGLVVPLGRVLWERYEFTADLQHCSIAGLCSECRKARQPAEQSDISG